MSMGLGFRVRRLDAAFSLAGGLQAQDEVVRQKAASSRRTLNSSLADALQLPYSYNGLSYSFESVFAVHL